MNEQQEPELLEVESEETIEEDYTLECNRLLRLFRIRIPVVLIAILGFLVLNYFDENKVFNPVNTNFFLFLNLVLVFLAFMIVNYTRKVTPTKKAEKHTYRVLRVYNETFDLLSVVPYLMLVITLSNAFFYSFSPISGTSMEPNFSDDETVVFSHQTEDYERFDVVIIYEESLSEPYLIKRVIGLPGETVIISNNEIIIEGQGTIEQDFIDTDVVKTYCINLNGQVSNVCSFEIPEDSYFVLGDNRDGNAVTYGVSGYSIDSRIIGAIDKENIFGKVVFKFRDYNLLK